MFDFKKERLKKDQSLGQGASGEVFPYQKHPDDMKWVVKRIKARNAEDTLRFLPEIVLGFSCDHPSLVPVSGYYIQPKNNKYEIYMRLPRMNGGNLAEEIKRRNIQGKYYSENELVKHFYALVCGVDYLHKKKIFHGDIKVNNILLDGEGKMKLSDIGSGKFIEDEDLYNALSGSNGAVLYKAPEIIKHERALQESNLKIEDERKAFLMESVLKKENLFLADAWSLGLTMLEICLLKTRLVHSYDPVEQIEERLQRLRGEASQRYREVLLEIVFGLLKVGPAGRMKVSDVKTRLEEEFKEILKDRENSESGNLERFKEETEKMIMMFEDDKKIKEVNPLNLF